MKKAALITWHLLLLGFVIFAFWVVTPKIQECLEGYKIRPENTLKSILLSTAAQGAGILMLVIASGLHLSRLFWNKCHWSWRVIFTLLLITAIIGVAVIIQVDLKKLGFTSYPDYFVYILNALLICLPIMITGHGYPSLLYQLYRHLRSKQAASHN